MATVPDHPPYGGTYDDVVAHLTIGHDHSRNVLAHAADAVSARLPIHAPICTVRLMAGSPQPGSWHTLCEFPLG